MKLNINEYPFNSRYIDQEYFHITKYILDILINSHGYPEKVLSKKPTYSNDITEKNKNPIIYFLLNTYKKNKDDFQLKSEIRYIGQSATIKRITQHRNKSWWDSYCYIEVNPKYINEIEAVHILRNKPMYNKTIPSNRRFKSIQNINTIQIRNFLNDYKYEMDEADEEKLLFDEHDPTFYIYNLMIYVDIIKYNYLYNEQYNDKQIQLPKNLNSMPFSFEKYIL